MRESQKTVARLMTKIIWGETNGWIDPDYRNMQTEEQMQKHNGAQALYERSKQELFNQLSEALKYGIKKAHT